MTEILMFGEIGADVTATGVSMKLAAAEGDVTVRVNSPGGSYYEGLAIMNALRAYPHTVTVIVDGLAASAASLIAVGGGDRLVMRPAAELMIHEAEAFAASSGNSAQLAKLAGDMDRLSTRISEVYAAKAGGDPADWRVQMKEETWFSADEAVAAGLADAVEDARQGEKGLVGAFNMSDFKYPGRAVAPAPFITARKGHEKEGDGMPFLNDVAHKLGISVDNVTEDMVLQALTEVLAEQIEVPVSVEMEYPDAEIKPGESIEVAPTGEVPDGVEFTVGDTPDGVEVAVGEAGVLTVTAGDKVTPGDTLEVPVTVTAGDNSVEVTVKLTVVEPPAEDPAPADEGTGGAAAHVTLDRDTYEQLRTAAEAGWQAVQEASAKALADEVDQWIADGRINASLRGRVVEAMNKDADAARALYGSNPKNTIPRVLLGTSRAPELEDSGASKVPSVEELKQRGQSRISGDQ